MISHFYFTDHECFSSDLRTRFQIGDEDKPEAFRGGDLAVVNSLSTTSAALSFMTPAVEDSLSTTPAALNLIEMVMGKNGRLSLEIDGGGRHSEGSKKQLMMEGVGVTGSGDDTGLGDDGLDCTGLAGTTTEVEDDGSNDIGSGLHKLHGEVDDWA
ncbi:unnamed protein product [Lactuca saligna]|uniref:Uncharacterized protein n=1 Tax=Lactuca saligna TaxID=75948 RepID=A0AA36ECX1_LACSI|nr:unnamed protein product [Lactuca saligna]